MKKVKFTITLMLLILSSAVISNAQARADKEKLSILDYYKLIPSYELDFERRDAKQKTLDLKNGYMELDVL